MNTKKTYIPGKPRNKKLINAGYSGISPRISDGGLSSEQTAALSNLSSWWKLDDNGNLYTELDVYSHGEVSAYGAGSGSGGGEGASALSELTDVSIASPAINDTLIYNGTHWVNSPQSPVIPDLSGYATQAWVTNGFAAKNHTHTIDGISGLQTALDTLSAVSHTHANKSVLDAITAAKTANWDTAYTNNHTHSNKSVIDGITSTNVTDWNTAATNFASRSANSAYAYLGATYISTGMEKPSYFGSGKLKLQMLNIQSNMGLGGGGTWGDVLWMSSYTGADVKGSNALVISKSVNKAWIMRQDYDSTAWGSAYELYHTANLNPSTFVTLADNQTITGLKTFAGSIVPTVNNGYNLGTTSARWANVLSVLGNFSGQITSTVATGAAPFVIASNTVVNNLNAQMATQLTTARTLWGQSFNGTANISGSMTGVGNIESTGYFYPATTNNRDVGMYGTYDSTRASHIWSIGATYRMNPNGSDFGTMYGLGYKYNTVVATPRMDPQHIICGVSSGQINFELGLSGWAYFAGNMGLGTAAVSGYRLSVNGSTKTTNLIVDSKTVLPYSGANWLTMATRANVLSGDQIQSASAAHALFNVKYNNGGVVAFGGLNNDSGLFGFTNTRINAATNGYDASILIMNGNAIRLSASSDRTDFYINSSGNIGLGNNAPSAKLHVSGNILATGEITAYSASDKRLKENITPLCNPLEILDKLNPVSYRWNEKALELNSNKTRGKDFGLIAQEVEEVLPEVIHTIYDEYKGIDYIRLIPFLIGAIKELRNEINTLKK